MDWNSINPAAIRSLEGAELKILAQELRTEMIDRVSERGGHLASSLGVVELTLALHRVFDTPHDRIVWDVGHQTYAHKLLTGRYDGFCKLRSADGCSGFPNPGESEYDPFIAGHAGTAVSAALGLAAADMLTHGGRQSRQVVAVVGDASLSCGVTLEGLNSVASSGAKVIVILNDNKMSISENVGAIASYLNRMLSGNAYQRIKIFGKNIIRKLPSHEKWHRRFKRLGELIKSAVLPGVFFEELGFRYLGPVDGHSPEALERVLRVAKNSDKPILIHLITRKGEGYLPARNAPSKFHGVGAFDKVTGKRKKATAVGFSDCLGETLLELATEREFAAITAAMRDGTGLAAFAEMYPKRFFDVGIAEEHAVTFAAGLAAGGMPAVAAVYSTFMQRAFDAIYHDVCLQNLPVILALDRAGAVEDGPTHHGIYDLGFLRSLPNLTVMAPMDEAELRAMLHQAFDLGTPVAIRYPRGGSGRKMQDACIPLQLGRATVVRDGDDGAIWALGMEVATALMAADLIEKKYGKKLAVVNPRYVVPFDRDLLLSQGRRMKIFSVEDHCVTGGLATTLAEKLGAGGLTLTRSFGWPREVIGHGSLEMLRRRYGLTAEDIARKIGEML